MNALKKPDSKFRTYDEMVKEGLPLRYSGKWTSAMTLCDAATGQGSPIDNYMYGVFMAEVSVAMKTGKVKVDKMTLVADIGKHAGFDLGLRYSRGKVKLRGQELPAFSFYTEPSQRTDFTPEVGGFAVTAGLLVRF